MENINKLRKEKWNLFQQEAKECLIELLTKHDLSGSIGCKYSLYRALDIEIGKAKNG